MWCQTMKEYKEIKYKVGCFDLDCTVESIQRSVDSFKKAAPYKVDLWNHINEYCISYSISINGRKNKLTQVLSPTSFLLSKQDDTDFNEVSLYAVFTVEIPVDIQKKAKERMLTSMKCRLTTLHSDEVYTKSKIEELEKELLT